MITNTRGKVGRFCLFKSAYKLGEDIVGTFDFSVGTVTCMQVITLLDLYFIEIEIIVNYILTKF